MIEADGGLSKHNVIRKIIDFILWSKSDFLEGLEKPFS